MLSKGMINKYINDLINEILNNIGQLLEFRIKFIIKLLLLLVIYTRSNRFNKLRIKYVFQLARKFTTTIISRPIDWLSCSVIQTLSNLQLI